MAKLENIFLVTAVLLSLGSHALAMLSNSEKITIVNTHNKLRSIVDPTASNMQALIWNNHLADSALLFSSLCKSESNPDRSSAISYIDEVGENWEVALNPEYESLVTKSWFTDGLTKFENNTCANFSGNRNPCDSYTQLVSGEASDLGCGSTVCSSIEGFSGSNPTILVCYYGSAYNLKSPSGQFPYIIGSPCSACSRMDQVCNNNLCDDPAGFNVTYTQDVNTYNITWITSLDRDIRSFCVNVTIAAMPPVVIISQCRIRRPPLLYQLQYTFRCVPINIMIIAVDQLEVAHTSLWFYDPCFESCYVPPLAICPDPCPPLDGYISSYNSTEENSVVTFWCDAGYYLSPPISFSTCNNSGSWIPEPAFTECLPIPTCLQPNETTEEVTSSVRLSFAAEVALVLVLGIILFLTGTVATTISLLLVMRVYLGVKDFMTGSSATLPGSNKESKTNLNLSEDSRVQSTSRSSLLWKKKLNEEDEVQSSSGDWMNSSDGSVVERDQVSSRHIAPEEAPEEHIKDTVDEASMPSSSDDAVPGSGGPKHDKLAQLVCTNVAECSSGIHQRSNIEIGYHKGSIIYVQSQEPDESTQYI